VEVHRFPILAHASGFRDQIFSFRGFHSADIRKAREIKYDAVYASSSRLFTAYLGAALAEKRKASLFLDMRDLFRENICEIIQNPMGRLTLNAFLRAVEHRTFKRACHINLVSEGFREDFECWNRPLTFFTNGIDSTFEGLSYADTNNHHERPMVITYAGNIGEGQGLHQIIPVLASAFPDRFKFKIYGDGGKRAVLEDAVQAMGLNNVFINDPVDRERLNGIYAKSDFLFVHLNRLKAFEKALPSKIFEYGAIGKPIIAGLAGYARHFVKENLPDVLVFDPCDSREAIQKLENWSIPKDPLDRRQFRETFNRKNIMEHLAETYLQSVC
jgi:glycosyltransferase involved in cell wall biosynthesis